MAHKLQELLGNDHPLFVFNVAELEKAAGHDGVDVRLLADVRERAHRVLRSLELDTANTTAVEAYQALKNLAKNEAGHRILENTDYVIWSFDGDLVSFNLQDIIENFHHEISFSDRVLGHAQRHLRAQIIKRYAEHERTHEDFVHKIAEDIGLKPPEDEGHPELRAVQSKAPSVLAVGDIFTDAFIKLNQDVARIDTDSDGSKRISLPLGSKPPYDGVDIVKGVGPSPNAAVAMARLGLDVSLLSFLGDDLTGHDAVRHMSNENISTELLSIQNNVPSNYYYVLRYGAERTILVKDEDFEYQWQAPKKEPDWVYLSLLSQRSWQLHQDLLEYLVDHPNVKLAFQPGTFHFEWGVNKLRDIYKRSHIVVMNREEAADVTGKSILSIEELIQALHELGPKIIVVTDGSNGSYASYDGKMVTIPNYPDPAPPLDRTGAGDAFASTIVAALAMGESMDTALTWAPINSMSVVQKLGAQAGLLSKEQIKRYLKNAPADYVISEVSS